MELAYGIALADRTEVAVAQVAAARSLSVWNQWYLFQCLKQWPQLAEPPIDAARILNAVRNKWVDLGLPIDEPTDEPI